MTYLKLTVLAIALLSASVAPALAQREPYNRLCDPAFENCRVPLLELINNEDIGIDVGFWFMQDTRYSAALIAAHGRGVRVRVVMDTQAFLEFKYAGADVPVKDMRDAGLPMREKTGGGGIFHFKTMIFAGQRVVQFSGANYSPEAFVPIQPYVNYVDEIIMFSNKPSIVDSFQRRFDDIWVDTTQFSDYANVVARVREYPLHPIDPELNFVPWNNFRSRSLPLYRAETVGIDSIMYRISDRTHADEMIAAVGRGVPVRIIGEQAEYRNPGKIWTSFNLDRMYMAGVQVRQRLHQGLNHEKLTLLHGPEMAIFGSSNWTSASAEGQHEHNLFTTEQWVYDDAKAHFDRKWNNTGPAAETQPFTPLPPDAPVLKLPLDSAQNQPLSVTLKWYAGLWAHKYDVFFGTSPSTMTKIADDVLLGPSESTGHYRQFTVSGLAEGTTYYWRVVSRTMANLTRNSPTWNFRTSGAPPTAGADDVVLWAWRAGSTPGWTVTNDTTAAGGKRLANPDAGAPKITTALASPTQYFELAFNATGGIPYRLWVRGKATANSYNNDSVFVQFSDSVTQSGTPTYRIGTTSATNVTIEECSGCPMSNWGWNDNGWGTEVLGPLIYFAESGTHTLRVQVREDGLSIDQIILSPSTFLNQPPGSTTADGTIYPEQGGVAVTPNTLPTVSLTSPASGASYTAPASVTISANAADADGTVDRVDFFANSTLVGSDTTAPFSVVWDANAPANYSLTARATDNRGGQTTSAARSITVTQGSVPAGAEVVRWANPPTAAAGWTVTADSTAAGGFRLQNPNAGAAKLTEAAASPAQYFDLTFNALAGRPYRLWIRGKATSNSYSNDSVFVQFSGSVTSTGTPTYRIGTTSSTTVTIEDAVNAGLAGWGWADNALGGLGPTIYFDQDGPQTVRIQTREDGLGIDQVVLSSVYYLNSSPGATKNDTTVLPETP